MISVLAHETWIGSHTRQQQCIAATCTTATKPPQPTRLHHSQHHIPLNPFFEKCTQQTPSASNSPPASIVSVLAHEMWMGPHCPGYGNLNHGELSSTLLWSVLHAACTAGAAAL
jgi:hypothetical protein